VLHSTSVVVYVFHAAPVVEERIRALLVRPQLILFALIALIAISQLNTLPLHAIPLQIQAVEHVMLLAIAALVLFPISAMAALLEPTTLVEVVQLVLCALLVNTNNQLAVHSTTQFVTLAVL